ncbi:hypothetical protein BB561_005525, partial [Smittium simulii]
MPCILKGNVGPKHTAVGARIRYDKHRSLRGPQCTASKSSRTTSFGIDVKESHSYTFPTVYKAEIKFKKRRRRTDSKRRALPTNSVNDTNQIRQLILWQLNSAKYLTEITPEIVTKFTEDEDNLGKKK